ncbi:DUF2946 family protein [Acuticoccus sp. I52.16.1]|uniref:DUF2946 family protein n=1 Tax=Acuticoccus sp. I52.16.1 TaxID=2928472 RepID=UPI001FCF91BC|nr:DUF2946 family protein [Acuticoccus sp. I52.16.1]UOM32674.1 hypothetical protein MRB58_12360 [Acuticoccus sp. I52.16.1]
MAKSMASGGPWRASVPQALRALRSPLVALCALLLLANHLAPVASFGADHPSTALCHGAAPTGSSDDGGGAGDRTHFQSCCFTAAMGLVPAAVVAPTRGAPCPRSSLPGLSAPLVAASAPSHKRIRAPPLA